MRADAVGIQVIELRVYVLLKVYGKVRRLDENAIGERGIPVNSS